MGTFDTLIWAIPNEIDQKINEIFFWPFFVLSVKVYIDIHYLHHFKVLEVLCITINRHLKKNKIELFLNSQFLFKCYLAIFYPILMKLCKLDENTLYFDLK